MSHEIYLAYGSNLNKRQMSMRCPDAKPLGILMLPNYRLVFKGVADIIPAEGMKVPVALWSITEKCEKSLDRYEGFPNLYRKEYFHNKNTDQSYMAYVMNGYGLGLPSKSYYTSIAQGYEDFDIDLSYLKQALEFTTEYQSDDGYTPRRWKD